MTRLATKTATAAIASAFMAVSVLPAEAMPAFKPAPTTSENIQTVQYRGGYNGGYRHDRGYDRGHHHGGKHHHNNGRDRRYYKQKDNNDAWVPLAILGAGALIIGGAVAANNNNRVPVNSGVNPRHFDWCYDKYRSYRSSDNTFQPYNGPRKQCYSPYY